MDRPIAWGRLIVKDDLANAEFVEEVPQAVMLDLAREGPATHDPGLDVWRTAFGNSSQKDSDLAQRAVLILVCGRKKERAGRVEEVKPLHFADALAIEVELVGFIDQFDRPAISRMI